MMLDDLSYIHQRDVSDSLGIVEKQWQQLQQEFELPEPIRFDDVIQIVFAGMGGSAIAGLFASVWPGSTLPFFVCRDYDLPSSVNQQTLVIVSSYSGNTEETLEALRQAQGKTRHIAVITGGGRLQELAEANKYPTLLLPKTAQPRYAVFASLRALVTLLGRTPAIAGDVLRQLADAGPFLQTQLAYWRPDVPTARNIAKRIALELIGKSVVIYSGPKMAPAAYKWKIGINENAKQVAWQGQYPEFNHNEFIGWSKQPIDKPYAIVDLRSPLENERVQKRFKVSARLLSGMRPEPLVVTPQGGTILEQLLWFAALGDFVSIYLALLNNQNPAPVDLVETFKKVLNQPDQPAAS